MTTQLQLHNVLSERHPHPRDEHIHFEAEGHAYTILTDANSKYTSVTTFLHKHFAEFHADTIIDTMMKGSRWKPGHKYWGLSPQEIKDMWEENRNSAAELGTAMHFSIECFMNNPFVKTPYLHATLLAQKVETEVSSLEWTYFLRFVQDHPDFKPYRTEWLVYDEDVKIAGSIDMVYENPDGTLSIYDWKRAKEITRINSFNKFAVHPLLEHLPDTNYWHYALQLNTYKAIIEKYYGKIVKELFLVRLHPDAIEQTYQLVELPDLSTEIQDLFLERREQVHKK